jgi:dolichyl-phosphate beta-glucosyltransferase
VVDDSSEDATVGRVLEFSRSWPQVVLVPNPAALGIGYAARHGILLSRGTRILLSAAEPPEPWWMLSSMEQKIAEGFDLVVATNRVDDSRPLPAVRIRRELLRRATPVIGNRDPLSKAPDALRFHLYSRESAFEIYRRQLEDGPSFGIEVLYLARRYRYRVSENGIAQPTSTASIELRPARSAARFGDLIRIRFNRLRGRYG